MPYNAAEDHCVIIAVAEKTAASSKKMKSLWKKKSQFTLAQKPLPSLAACLLMDFLGYASFAIPVLGELLDIIWAPISAGIYLKMFGVRRGFFGGVFNFVEELLPGFDIIPTFTITWCIHYFRRSKETYTIQAVSR